MAISSAAVGAAYPPRDVQITKRDLLSFAAGLGAVWPDAMDDARPEGIVGFPTYCASLEFNAFAGRAAGVNPVGADAAEARRGVHAGQDSLFHSVLRPGRRLRTTGRVVSARTSSAGAVLGLKVDTVDLSDGSPVTTSWVTQLYRGIPLTGEPQTIEAPPQPPEVRRLRAPMHVLDFEVDRAWPHVYAECSNIWNPIHSERAVALAAGLPDIILQGTATWGLAAREVVSSLCAGDPARLARFGGQFSAMVCPGDRLQVAIFAAEGPAVAYEVRNQRRELVLRDGFAVIR